MKLRTSTTGLVIFLLLTALTVSAGEGVRLFPFAEPHRGINGSESVSLPEGSSLRYSIAAHRSSPQFKYGKIKQLKKELSADSAMATTADDAHFETARIFRNLAGFPLADGVVFAAHLQLPTGRAPPVI